MCESCGGHGHGPHDPDKPVLVKPVSIKLIKPEDVAGQKDKKD